MASFKKKVCARSFIRGLSDFSSTQIEDPGWQACQDPIQVVTARLVLQCRMLCFNFGGFTFWFVDLGVEFMAACKTKSEVLCRFWSNL